MYSCMPHQRQGHDEAPDRRLIPNDQRGALYSDCPRSQYRRFANDVDRVDVSRQSFKGPILARK